MVRRVLRPLEDRGRGVDDPGVNAAEPLAGLGDPGHLGAEFPGLSPVLTLLDGPREVGVEQPVLHSRQLGLKLRQRGRLPLLLRRDVVEGGAERPAEELPHVLGLDAERGQLVGDRLLERLGFPPQSRMIGRRVVVPAAVVHVLVDGSPSDPAPDALARYGEPAMGAADQPSGEGVPRRPGPPVPPAQDALAGVEGLARHEPLVSALEDVSVAHDLADVEAVVEDVGQRRAGEPGLALPIDVALAPQGLGEQVERHVAAGEELEDPNDGPGILGVGPHGLLAVARHVDVAVRGEPRGPALPHSLVHALEDLGSEVVAVVLRDGGHHVEGQGSGGARAELVVDERQLDAARVLQFLEPHGVAHVAAHAIELVAEDGPDPLALGVGPDPGEHLVECDALGPPPCRLGDDELPGDRPPLALGAIPRGAELGVDRVSLALLARGDAGPDDHSHGSASPTARRIASPNLLMLMMISIASSSPTTLR